MQDASIVAHKEIALPEYGEELPQGRPAAQISYPGYVSHLRKDRLPERSLLCAPEQHNLRSIRDEMIGQRGETRSRPTPRRGIGSRARMERDQWTRTIA
jgi:hypothetical protein